MPLHDLQQRFSRAIVANAPAGVEASIAAAGDVLPAERLSIYHHNVTGNLADGLADTFSATRKLVGDDFFHRMARDFIPGHLPPIANLNRYGAEFPAFIGTYAPAKDVPYLAEVARFEWLWNEAFLAGDDAALSPQDVTQLAPDDYPALRFTLRAGARLMVSDYPVDAIWRWCEDGGEGELPDMHAGNVHLLIARPELEVHVSRLPRAEYAMLHALSAGKTLETAAQNALSEDVDFDLSAFLTRHFALKTFQSLC